MVCITIPAQAATAMIISNVSLQRDDGSSIDIGFDVNVSGTVNITLDTFAPYPRTVMAGHNILTLSPIGRTRNIVVCIEPA